jgi:hypothetical protein
MGRQSIFYSWQSDLPGRGNRNLIGDALEKVVKDLLSDDSLSVEPVIDRDTLGVPGAPDIAATIFRKIDSSAAFVCDVSIVSRPENGRPCPNPNVLIELGYALKSLKHERLVLVFNTAYGKVEELPFDLRLKRVLTYHMTPDFEPTAARNALVSTLTDALRAIFNHIAETGKDTEASDLLSELNQVLIRTLIVGEESHQRRINPWAQEVVSVFESTACSLRTLAAKKAAHNLGIVDQLETLAESLYEVVHFPRSLGDGEEFSSVVNEAVKITWDLKRTKIDSVSLNAETKLQIPQLIDDQLRQMKQWVARGLRIDENEFYRIRDDFFRDITSRANVLLQLAYHNLEPIFPGLSETLKKEASPLHLIYLENELNDYQVSEIVDQVKQRIDALEAATAHLAGNS